MTPSLQSYYIIYFNQVSLGIISEHSYSFFNNSVYKVFDAWISPFQSLPSLYRLGNCSTHYNLYCNGMHMRFFLYIYKHRYHLAYCQICQMTNQVIRKRSMTIFSSLFQIKTSLLHCFAAY